MKLELISGWSAKSEARIEEYNKKHFPKSKVLSPMGQKYKYAKDKLGIREQNGKDLS